MPFLEMDTAAGKKRKRSTKALKPSKSQQPKEATTQESRIVDLESQILESRKHYNNIVTLISLAKESDDAAILANVALCRVYCRFLAAGNLNKNKDTTEAEALIVQWLRERLNEYVGVLLGLLGSEATEGAALMLLMRLVKEEVNHRGHIAWSKGIFGRLINVLLAHGQSVHEFEVTYFKPYADVRFYTLELALLEIQEPSNRETAKNALESSINLLLSLGAPSEEMLSDFYASTPHKRVASLSSHQKYTQAAWLAILSSSALAKEQRKTILTALVPAILPWITKPERLLDFLTHFFDQGGSTSLLCLSGLFHLMQEKNLDYPSFYAKLYSLLDDNLLHSKHRSRFFRLLETFMSSTHLPAALVASFIKRLARLALLAPPAGIVVVIPWIYNMFKVHPQCTFLIHRTALTPSQSSEWETGGFVDPFDNDETDPLETGAIDSSLWELQTLQDHYHPNVASLAKIISEPFTKERYNLEDFLDHSYSTLIGAEVGKEMKRTPAVEYQIPKVVFGAENEEGNQLAKLMGFVMGL